MAQDRTGARILVGSPTGRSSKLAAAANRAGHNNSTANATTSGSATGEPIRTCSSKSTPCGCAELSKRIDGRCCSGRRAFRYPDSNARSGYAQVTEFRFSGSHAIHSYQCRPIRHSCTANRPPHEELDGRIARKSIPPKHDPTAPSLSRSTDTNASLSRTSTLASSVIKHPSRRCCRNRQSVPRHARPRLTDRRTINGTQTVSAQQRTAPPTHTNPTDRPLSKSTSHTLRRLSTQQRVKHQRQRQKHQRRIPIDPNKPHTEPRTTDGAMERPGKTVLQQPRPPTHARRSSTMDPARAPLLRQPQAIRERSTMVPPRPTNNLLQQPHHTARLLVRALDATPRPKQKQRSWLRPCNPTTTTTTAIRTLARAQRSTTALLDGFETIGAEHPAPIHVRPTEAVKVLGRAGAAAAAAAGEAAAVGSGRWGGAVKWDGIG